MNINFEILLNALVAYFVVVDPVGVSLIFNGLLGTQDVLGRRRVALRAVTLCLPLVVGFGLFGASLLGRLGITMEAFRIAGGLLLFHTAFYMVVRPDTPSQNSRYDPPNDIAVFPLSFPLIAGPGCLTLTILLFADGSKVAGGLLSATLAIVIILAVTLAALLSSHRISRLIGNTANAVIKKLLGVLLASLAVQFIADGILTLVGPQLNRG